MKGLYRQRALSVSEWKNLLSEIEPQNAEITEQNDDEDDEVTSKAR